MFVKFKLYTHSDASLLSDFLSVVARDDSLAKLIYTYHIQTNIKNKIVASKGQMGGGVAHPSNCNNTGDG